ncbi:DMT family transporter [Allopusillimonas ginsengisoli]|uniref:DMT family transporter n=1 Tax=Allopusillimonas ginsengisoli TaxID=453575 RepID=UPI001021BEBD|nr:DMT family transporter [Allopusillimonas ginsengisoli]TEA77859.1 DMT family transporter [Allopusillimonas ginsengisoli]
MKPSAGASAGMKLASAAVQPLTGIGLLVASVWALSGLDASGKYVMGTGVPLLVLCLVRYLVHLVLVLALVVPAKGWRMLRCQRPWAQTARGASMLLATMSFFTTLHYLPQAQATAINFLAPLLVLAVAPWVLKEPMRVSRWVAAGVGFLGVLVVVRPGSGLDHVGTMFGLLTACILSVQYITTRRVAVDDPYTSLIWSGAVGSVVMLLALPFIWGDVIHTFVQLSGWQWLILLGTGFWGALGHLLQIQAYRCAPASLLAPFVYLQIISAATLGWLIWGQFPDGLSWLGIGIVCMSGITIAMVEWRRRNL